ncbi:PAS domain S-box protein [Desulfosarcina ovata]|nr:PAS domain S-box protein [Desulfosarcina ovata]
MKDENKTRSQLIDELQEMRNRVADLQRNSTVENHEKVRAEALRESEERLRLALDAANDGIWDWDPGTGRTYFSPRYYTMLGYAPDEFPPMYESWRRLIHPDDVETAEASVRNALEERVPFAVEFRMKAKNGSWRWILGRGKVAELDAEKKAVRVVGSHTDITEHKRTAEALEKRIVALTQPLEDVEGIAFEDLFNLANIQHLQDLYAEAFGVAALITRPDGTPITRPSNFTVLCSQFIRNTEKGSKNCTISDALIGRHNPAGPIIQPCLSAGLCNAGASITVGGRHIANWLIGQVRNENQKEEDVMAYARELGADESAFRAAYRQVPVMSEEQFERVANVVFTVANQLSMSAYQNIQQARFITERKQTEESLRLTQFIFDKAPIGIWRMGPAGEVLDVNEAACASLGYTRETLCRMTVFDFAPGFDIGDWENGTNQLNETGTKITEAFHQRKSGELFPIQVLEKLVRFKGQEYRLAFVQDITERKRTEKSLRLAQFIIDNANIGIYRIDSAGRIIEVNRKAAQLLGYTKEELESLTMPDIDPLVARTSWWVENWRKLTALGTRDLERQHRRKDGSVFPVEVHSNLLEYEGQQYAIAFVKDITERKRIEESLRLTQFIFDKAPIGIWRMGPTGEVLDVNEAACTSLGYTREAFCRMTAFDVAPGLTPSDWDIQTTRLNEARTITIEAFHQRKGGEIFPVQVIAKLMRFEGQEYHLAFVQDISERKQNEDALREKDQLLHDIGKLVRIGAWKFDPETGKVTTTEEVARIYDFESAQDLSVEKGLGCYHGANREIMEHAFYGLIEQGTPYDLELEIVSAKGIRKWVRTIGHPVMKDGRIIQVQGSFQDISERKQAEENLRKHERLLANILESMSEGVFVLDSDFTVTIYNRGMEVITNVPRESVIGKRPWEVFPHIKNLPVEENIRNVMKGELPVAVKTTHPHNPNVWSRDSFSPIKDADGGVVGVVGVLTDITRQKQAEEELRQLRNYLSNIIDSMPSILVAVDRDGKVTQWNRQTEKTTGLSFEKARFQPLTKVFPRLSGEMDRIGASIRERRVISSPKVTFELGNEIRYEDITIFPLVGNGVKGAVIRLDDVTQQVRLEEMMIQSEKMLSVGGLAAGMAHEINNPLAGILQNASVLRNRLMGDLPANRQAAEAAGITPAAIRHYLELRRLPDMIDGIHESVNRAAAIVRNMLSFARKSDRIFSSQDLGVLLDRTLDLVQTDYSMKTHYDFKHIHINREYDPAPPVLCEATKLQQVFMNILKNGAEAMAGVTDASASPTFVLCIRDDDNWVQVEIEDNGPGMDEKTRRRIFEPFFTTKPVGQGTGLGLSVSYFIIAEDHGGEMRVHATAGGGTCFVIRLPKAGKSGT